MKFGLPISFTLHGLIVFGGLLILGKTVSTVQSEKIIPLKIVTVTERTNIKPSQKETPKKELPQEVPQISEPVEKAVPETLPSAPPEKPKGFSLDDFSNMIKKTREKNPDASVQKVLVGEAQAAEIAQNGVGEKTDLTITPGDYIRTKMEPCWLIDKGAKNYQNLRVEVRLELSEKGEIDLLNITNSAQIIASPNNGWRAARENVVSALNECAPYDGLRTLDYDEWKTMKLNFQPGDAE